jgi:class 3 adenylate cyclase
MTPSELEDIRERFTEEAAAGRIYVTMLATDIRALIEHAERCFGLTETTAELLKALFNIVEPVAGTELLNVITATRATLERAGL